MDPPPRALRPRLETAMLAASVAAPLLLCAAASSRVADAAHDEAVARALGFAWSGAFRALDVPVASSLLWLPFGTRALRAALACAACGGIAGGALFLLARRLLVGTDAARRIRAIVAALAVACATLSFAFVSESSSAGSSIVGVVLVLGPLLLVTGGLRREGLPLLSLALGLAVSYEPFVGLIACAGALAPLAFSRGTRASGNRRALRARCAGAFACGCLPFFLAVAWRRWAARELGPSVWHAWLGEGATPGSSPLVPLLHGELGWTLLALGAVGAGWSLARRASRPVSAGVLAVLLASALAVALGAPAGAGRFGAAALTLVGAVAVFAAVPMHALVVAIVRSKVPLAPASAAMVILLELTFPVLTLDDTLARRDADSREATRAWDDASFEALSSGALLLVRDRALYARAAAARATGELRGDLSIVPLFEVSGFAAERELVRDDHLRPLWRDLVLAGGPREWSLSEAAGSRQIAFALDSTWDRPLLRHVVPRGLWMTFEPEPRGPTERMRALDAAVASEGPLEEAVVVRGDAPLAALTDRLVDDRSVLLASLGERDAAVQILGAPRSLGSPTAANDRLARRGLAHASRLMPIWP